MTAKLPPRFDRPRPRANPRRSTGGRFAAQVEGLESRRLLAAPPVFGEFLVPTANSQPIGIVTGSDGNLWFTQFAGNKVASINPTTQAITEFPLPNPNSGPYGITSGSDGALWFAEYTGNRIGRIDPNTGAITEFLVPTQNSRPEIITSGPDGNLWFTEQTGNNIGQLNLLDNDIIEIPVPTPSSNLQAITTGPDGSLWFAEFQGNKIGRINPITFGITEYPVLAGGNGPSGITSGPDGNLWFTSVNSNSIGTISPTTFAFTNTPVPTPQSFLANIVTGPNGQLAFLEFGAGQVGQIDPVTRVVTETPIPTPNSGPNSITVGPDRLLWFTERNANQIGRVDFNPPTADLSIQLTAQPEPVTPEGLLTYTIQVSNPGPNTALNVNLVDVLPLGTSFVSSTAPMGWKVSSPNQTDGGMFGAFIRALPIATVANFTIVVRVSANALDGSSLVDTASVSSPTFDPNPQNSMASVTSRVSSTPPLSFVVTNPNDSGRGSLRQAILNANSVGGQLIRFAIPEAILGPIVLRTPLPTITGPSIIDGGSEARFLGRFPAGPMVELDGRGIGRANGLTFGGQANGSLLHGLSIVGFLGAQVEVDAPGVTLWGNFLGLRADGTPVAFPTPEPGGVLGVNVTAPGVVIGGLGSGQGNVLSGNAGQGVQIVGASARGVSVRGNVIGLDPTGSVARGNGHGGIAVFGGAGGEFLGPGNTVSGNGRGLIIIGSSGDLVIGNRIGTNASGLGPVGNLFDGIMIEGQSSLIEVGGLTADLSNVISGNGSTGVHVRGGSSNVSLLANLIGTDISGTRGIGNGVAGVLIENSASNTIGPGNLISGNGSSQAGAGLWIEGPDATRNVIYGNKIGTNLAGDIALGNSIIGVLVNDAPSNAIGAGSLAAPNLISGNNSIGVMLAGSGASGNLVAGNLIGTDIQGSRAIPNGASDQGAGLYLDDAPSNVIGGATPGFGNLISGNAFVGVQIFGPGSTGTVLQGNAIGTDLSGTRRLSNGNDGLLINGAPSTLVVSNIVSANAVNGITISGPGTSNTTVQGNLIGLGIGGQPLGNGTFGILVINGAATPRQSSNQIANNGLGPIRDTNISPTTAPLTASKTHQARVKIQAKAHSFGSRPSTRSQPKR